MWQRMFRLGHFYFEGTVYRWFWPDWLVGISFGLNSLSLDYVVGSVIFRWGME